MADFGPVTDHEDFDVYPYEYVSGVARLEEIFWWVDIYMVNRGTTPAKSVVSVFEPRPATDGEGLFEIIESFRDDITIPPGQVGIAYFGDLTEKVFADYYWVRVATTSSLVVSAAFYRGRKFVLEGEGVVEHPKRELEPALSVAFGPGDFAVFSPSSPVRQLPTVHV